MNVYRIMKREIVEKYQVKLEDLIIYLKNEIKNYNPKLFTEEELLAIDQRLINAVIKGNAKELPSPYRYILEQLYIEDINLSWLIDVYFLDKGAIVYDIKE